MTKFFRPVWFAVAVFVIGMIGMAQTGQAKPTCDPKGYKLVMTTAYFDAIRNLDYLGTIAISDNKLFISQKYTKYLKLGGRLIKIKTYQADADLTPKPGDFVELLSSLLELDVMNRPSPTPEVELQHVPGGNNIIVQISDEKNCHLLSFRSPSSDDKLNQIRKTVLAFAQKYYDAVDDYDKVKSRSK